MDSSPRSGSHVLSGPGSGWNCAGGAQRAHPVVRRRGVQPVRPLAGRGDVCADEETQGAGESGLTSDQRVSGGSSVFPVTIATWLARTGTFVDVGFLSGIATAVLHGA
ncbi:hypothetical protein AAFF_G00066040 [Aldrovandia affinis]|uniref:Uncharacterized protein n=1 Tax=Aldrovandia affinis TaxID=143900 RepID=A0AAD7T5Q1_9TELE|nr:hypothetical protein AAFF_G00066040 [Aldrovandia affinis]